MLGPQIGNTVISAFCSCNWGPFSTLGLLHLTDFSHLHQNKLWHSSDADWTTARLLTSSTYHRCHKETHVFCLLHSRDFLRSQQTVWLYEISEHCHQFNILFVLPKSHSYFGFLYCCIIIRCRTTWTEDWLIAKPLPLVQQLVLSGLVVAFKCRIVWNTKFQKRRWRRFIFSGILRRVNCNVSDVSKGRSVFMFGAKHSKKYLTLTMKKLVSFVTSVPIYQEIRRLTSQNN
jgi:hypothetical protein